MEVLFLPSPIVSVVKTQGFMQCLRFTDETHKQMGKVRATEWDVDMDAEHKHTKQGQQRETETEEETESETKK